ncbi:methyltransferase domain-containing protein [bacterium]|nr:methyltransferase domain-containing protein [bacterium]
MEKILNYLKTFGKFLFYIPQKYRFATVNNYFRFQSLFFKGDKVFCSCCSNSFRKFLPYGAKLRQNALCPRCGSLERHRLLWLFLLNETNLFNSELKVIHFAPEYVFQNAFLKMKNLDYLSVDLSSPLAKMNGVDVTKIPFPEKSFDVVFCNHVLEHVEDDHKAMSELFRILKPNGWAVFQIPLSKRETTYEDFTITSPKGRFEAFGQDDHVRIYGSKDYPERLEKAGFKVKIVDYVSTFDESGIKKFGLMKGEKIYFCSRDITLAEKV